MTAELSCGSGQRRPEMECRREQSQERNTISPKAGLFPCLNHNCLQPHCLPPPLALLWGRGGCVWQQGVSMEKPHLTGCPQEGFRATFSSPSSPPKDEARPRERSGFWGSSILHPGTSPSPYTQQRNLQVPFFQFSGKHHTPPPHQRGKQCGSSCNSPVAGGKGPGGQQPYLRCPRG